jgi:branched-chain amino acid transport system ATP-binding protein
MATASTDTHAGRTAADAAVRLRLEDAQVAFAGVKAIDGVNLSMDQGEILGLIGPNGAGKTTLVNVLSGYQRSQGGRMFLGDREVTGWSPRKLALNGLSRTFQNVRLFGRLTVAENVEVGLVCAGASRARARVEARELLRRVALEDDAERPARSLPYGAERRLGIVRALATRPRFMLLDEPAAGLNEAESDDLVTVLRAVRDDLGCGLVIIEHDMPLIMRLCDRVQVLDYGKTIAVGTPAEIRRDPVVLEAYLGTHAEPPTNA